MREFRRFVGIARPEEFRTVTRAHVIAWRDGSAVRAIRLDAELRLLDPSPLEIAQNAAASEVSLVTTGTGVTIVYSRIDGAIARVFTRTLDRLGAEPRRRAIGR